MRLANVGSSHNLFRSVLHGYDAEPEVAMVRVTSEIGRLRKVLVHEPGPEVDRMVPPMMEELLFDDILFGDRARDEHRRFRRLLQLVGIEVVEARDLLTEALETDEARAWLWDMLAPELGHEMRSAGPPASAEELVTAAVEGIITTEAPQGIEVKDLFQLAPLPNWCFQRDPQIVLGDGVVFGAMATAARWREGVLARCLFRFHPGLREAGRILDPLREAASANHLLGPHRPRLEGGDVLVLSDEVVAIGVSERTNIAAAEMLSSALAGLEGGPRWLEVVHVPARRAYMHLDTVFTPLDRDAALVFPPVICGAGPQLAETYEIDLQAMERTPRHRGCLLDTLSQRGVDLEPISCGGDNPIAQQREQWTDGANAFALAPGVIVLYDRNVATAEELDRLGFRVINAEDVLLGREEVSLDDPGRVCLLLESHEISRARGGPHCLTHPLVRDDL
jgi:arginine deiminase